MLKYNLDISKSSKWIISVCPEGAQRLPFYITEAGEFFAGNGYYTERDGRSGYQLIYTAEGSGKFTCGDADLELTPNTAIIIRCNDLHRYASLTDKWHNLWIHFDGCGADAFEPLINDTGYCRVEIPDPSSFEAELYNLIALASNSNMISCAIMSDCVSRLMTAVLTQKLRIALNPDKNGGRYPEIHTVLSFIHRNYPQAIGIEDMISQVNISKYHFIRIFKRQMGVTPYEYLTNYRISRAKILLRTTDKSIFEISCDIGYKSKSNFVAKFRSVTGTTPSRYRKENIVMK